MKQRNRDREIVVTVPRAIWEELQRDVRANGLEGEHGANQRVLMAWLAEYLRGKGRLGSAADNPVTTDEAGNKALGFDD